MDTEVILTVAAFPKSVKPFNFALFRDPPEEVGG